MCHRRPDACTRAVMQEQMSMPGKLSACARVDRESDSTNRRDAGRLPVTESKAEAVGPTQSATLSCRTRA